MCNHAHQLAPFVRCYLLLAEVDSNASHGCEAVLDACLGAGEGRVDVSGVHFGNYFFNLDAGPVTDEGNDDHEKGKRDDNPWQSHHDLLWIIGRPTFSRAVDQKCQTRGSLSPSIGFSTPGASKVPVVVMLVSTVTVTRSEKSGMLPSLGLDRCCESLSVVAIGLDVLMRDPGCEVVVVPRFIHGVIMGFGGTGRPCFDENEFCDIEGDLNGFGPEFG